MNVSESNPESVTLVDVGRPGTPGCLTVTAIDTHGDDVAQVDAFVNQIIEGLTDQPGYLGTLFASTSSGRHFTVSAWESVEAVDGLRRTSHIGAVRAFFDGTVGTRVVTSVWVPQRVNDVWVKAAGANRPERTDSSSRSWL